MAYKLKTTGIAANCTMCIAVDPDTGTVKDFASELVTADIAVGANVTIGSQSWDGNTRSYFRHGSGTTADDFVAFGTNKPSWTFNASGQKRTVVFIGEVAGGGARVFGKDSTNYFASGNLSSGGATTPTISVGAGAKTGGQAALVSGNKRIFGFSMEHGVGTTAYIAADTDAAMVVVSGLGAYTSTSASNNYDLGYIGRRNDNSSHQQDKVHAALIFDADLTEAQWDSLRDDWFGTLLEVDASGAALDLDPSAAALTGTISLSGDIASQIKRWRVPTTAPASTAVHVTILTGTSPTYTIEAQGAATVDANGNADIPATGALGTKALAIVHNYDDNTASSSIFGGPAIATLVDAG